MIEICAVEKSRGRELSNQLSRAIKSKKILEDQLKKSKDKIDALSSHIKTLEVEHKEDLAENERLKGEIECSKKKRFDYQEACTTQIKQVACENLCLAWVQDLKPRKEKVVKDPDAYDTEM